MNPVRFTLPRAALVRKYGLVKLEALNDDLAASAADDMTQRVLGRAWVAREGG